MSALFDSIRIARVTIPNRIVRSATGEGAAAPDGRVTENMIAFYDRLAAGGTGLIVTGHAYVHPAGRCGPRMTGIHCDDLIPDLKRLTGTVHRHDAKIVMQINHGGRQADPDEGHRPPIAPSALSTDAGEPAERAMTVEQIQEAIRSFAQAARRVREAGFDGVQIHSAHGYLVSEFNSGYTNRRTDEWGGSAEKRGRFVLEVLQAVRAQVGGDYPVLIKLNGCDFLENGITKDESAPLAAKLQAEGIDAIEISGAMRDSVDKVMRKAILKPEEEAYFRPEAQAIRAQTTVPLILTGGIRSPQVAEKLINDDAVDMVGMCRPLIRQPNLPNLWREGSRNRADCISCNQCASSPETANICTILDKTS